MIKLFIFESVQDALDFEHPARTVIQKPEVKVELGGGISEDPEPETAPPPAPRKYKRRKKVNTAKEAAKKRILEKAKAKAKGARTCKNCGKSGHMAKTCPESKKNEPELSQEQMNYIKELAEEGKSIAEIVIETGLPSQVVKEHMY